MARRIGRWRKDRPVRGLRCAVRACGLVSGRLLPEVRLGRVCAGSGARRGFRLRRRGPLRRLCARGHPVRPARAMGRIRHSEAIPVRAPSAEATRFLRPKSAGHRLVLRPGQGDEPPAGGGGSCRSLCAAPEHGGRRVRRGCAAARAGQGIACRRMPPDAGRGGRYRPRPGPASAPRLRKALHAGEPGPGAAQELRAPEHRPAAADQADWRRL